MSLVVKIKLPKTSLLAPKQNFCSPKVGFDKLDISNSQKQEPLVDVSPVVTINVLTFFAKIPCLITEGKVIFCEKNKVNGLADSV